MLVLYEANLCGTYEMKQACTIHATVVIHTISTVLGECGELLNTVKATEQRPLC